MRKYILLILFFQLTIQSCIQIKDTVINEDDFLGNKTNDTSIYEIAGNSKFLNPFNMNTDNWGAGNIERLMLVEFAPLYNYKTVELQIIEKEGQEAAIVILYFADGSQADVYHTPDIELSRDMYINILNKSEITATEMKYKLGEEGGKLIAMLEMTDRFGNHIVMNVKEENPEMKPVNLLAPIGGEADNPGFMTIVFMKHFRFLSQNEQNISVIINNSHAKLSKLPVKVNGIKGFQTKYSMDPITVCWNINSDQTLPEIKLTGDKLYSDKNIEIEVIQNKNHIEIRRFTGFQDNHSVNFRFSPAIPDLRCMANNAETKGVFVMSVDNIKGIIAGNYMVQKRNGQVTIQMHPTKGYSPVPGKAWMKKMTWNATITSTDSANFHITSEWIKK